jgi:hypothetical protein
MKQIVFLFLSLITTSIYAQTSNSKNDSTRFQLIKLSLEDELKGYSIRDTSQANIKTAYFLDSIITKQQLPKSPDFKDVLLSNSEIREAAKKDEIYFARLSGFTLNTDSAQIIWESVCVSYEDNRFIQRIHGRSTQNYHHTIDGWKCGICSMKIIDYGK